MGRKAKGARLWFDEGRGTWVIRDGSRFKRTRCPREDRAGAEQALADYIASKYTPPRGSGNSDILCGDVLLAYLKEQVPVMLSTRSQGTAKWNALSLAPFWGKRPLADVRGATCRAYAEGRPASAARRELETLKAAINHWHREHGPLPAVPKVTLPPASVSRQRWLTRPEAARLLSAARQTPHIARFVLLGLATGTRAGALLGLQWMPNTTGGWIDLDAGVMYRRGEGERETRKRRPAVRLGANILGHLRRWHRQDGGRGYVVTFDGSRIASIKTAWGKAVRRSGLEGVMPHTLRHTRATWLMQAGVPPWEAAGSLGMTVQQLERTYGHHSPHFQRRAAEV